MEQVHEHEDEQEVDFTDQEHPLQPEGAGVHQGLLRWVPVTTRPVSHTAIRHNGMGEKIGQHVGHNNPPCQTWKKIRPYDQRLCKIVWDLGQNASHILGCFGKIMCYLAILHFLEHFW